VSDGFGMIPNALIDALALDPRLTLSDHRVVLYIVRQSIGYNRADSGDFGSFAAISRGTGLSRRTVVSTLGKLQGLGVLSRTRPPAGTRPAAYSVQPAREWARGEPQITGELQITSDPQITHRGEPQITPGGEPQITPQKTRIKKQVKDNNNKASSWLDDIRSIEDEESAEGRIDIADLRQRLGMRISIADVARPKWIGISQQDPARVEELLTWAAGTADPASAFTACFDATGKPKAQRRAKPAAGRTPEEKKAYFAEITRKAEEQLATMTPLTRR